MSNIDLTIENVINILKEEYAERYLKEDDHSKIGKVNGYVSSIVAELPERKEMIFQFHHDRTITVNNDTIPIEHLKVFIHDKEKYYTIRDEIHNEEPYPILEMDYVAPYKKDDLAKYLSEYPKWKERIEQLVLMILKRKDERLKEYEKKEEERKRRENEYGKYLKNI